ncbi:MAG: hypothetical protein Q8N00_13035 [Nitrospirota bacterium]|nr:hypothetical protein [Nitrospirota bacterium]
MDVTLRKEIEAMKADPDFVELVMAWHGVIGATDVPFTAEKESPTYQRKIKRWVQRDYGAQWKPYWKVILNESWKARRQIVLKRNLFKIQPHAPSPNHRRRNEALWSAVFDLRNYFEKISGRSHMGLLGRLFYPNQQEVTFNAEWHERKDWFKDEKGAERLNQLEFFYKHYRARILETLRTGIPFYAKWESASPVGPSGASH